MKWLTETSQTDFFLTVKIIAVGGDEKGKGDAPTQAARGWKRRKNPGKEVLRGIRG